MERIRKTAQTLSNFISKVSSQKFCLLSIFIFPVQLRIENDREFNLICK